MYKENPKNNDILQFKIWTWKISFYIFLNCQLAVWFLCAESIATTQ